MARFLRLLRIIQRQVRVRTGALKDWLGHPSMLILRGPDSPADRSAGCTEDPRTIGCTGAAGAHVFEAVFLGRRPVIRAVRRPHLSQIGRSANNAVLR